LSTSNAKLVEPTPLAKSDKNPEKLNAGQVTLSESTRAIILNTLEATGWVVGGPGGAAEQLGLKRTTLMSKMKKLRISRQRPQSDVNGAESMTVREHHYQ
jgi:transcriptional regulator with GAF, ATPase, and Fis domain